MENSQKNTCVRASFLIKLQAKHLRWLLLCQCFYFRNNSQKSDMRSQFRRIWNTFFYSKYYKGKARSVNENSKKTLDDGLGKLFVLSYLVWFVTLAFLFRLCIKAGIEEPKKLIYKNYSNFFQKDFYSKLLLNIWHVKNSYLEFEENFVKTLDKHALKKVKIFWWNHKPCTNKTLRKTITKLSQLKNKANKTKDPKDISKYKKERNYVFKLNNQSKQEHFYSLNPFLVLKAF